MINRPMTLRDLIHQNGPLSPILATNYINEIAGELERMHTERRICHLDVRPETIAFGANGKVGLMDSSLSQSYSKEGAEVDFRDLKAVHHYLLTGKKTEKGPEIKTEKKSFPLSGMFLVAGVACLLCVAAILFLQRRSEKVEIVSRKFADFYYQGEWKNEAPHGRGTAKYYDGRYYEGHFVKGIRSDKNALFVYADGNVFNGTFSADTIQSGKVTLVSGEFYFEGEFSNGKPYSGYWHRTSDDKRVEQVIKGKEILL